MPRSGPERPLPYPVYCHGHHRDGEHCRNPRPLATVVDGLAIVQDHGRTHVDPASTSCPQCGTVRSLRGGEPEELLGRVPIPVRVYAGAPREGFGLVPRPLERSA